jgi:plastocyanin
MRSTHRIAVAGSGVALAMLLLPATPAGAGGGCHNDAATEGTGAMVALSQMCMTPTVLRVDPGTTVTFVNKDSVVHNVWGLQWGQDPVNAEESFQRRFDSAGIYPYTCSLHPGMVGAVVVGDGRGSGPVIEMPSVTPSIDAAALPAAVPAATSTADDDSANGVLPFALGAAAVAVAAGVAFRAGRRRSPAPTP